MVTQPDRPVGRNPGNYCPASEADCAGRRPSGHAARKIRNNAEFRTPLSQSRQMPLLWSRYGRIVPPWMLALPRFGCINLHASLLPKYRGAAPIQWAVAMGESSPAIRRCCSRGSRHRPHSVATGDSDPTEKTAADLFEELAIGGAPLMVETLKGLANGTVSPKPQDHSGATFPSSISRASLLTWAQMSPPQEN